ncbi:hypothetical protein BCR36DRAFT_588576 [Piromyces finnis]|uniref:Protein EFR3 n=1 Tax=Piromyces finnis TaxID=1754191 RepID=A0A1Y1U776_9FUNG|nr:hypothetical protein BCR36DRAFT_588576 [Piromyces finnis]|eukprot:ORX33883.1 hypothetical protein BCR36DRAFT_588576 [Piromyces finnis]
MSSYARSQFDINNLEIYKEDSYNSNVRINNQEKINYSVYKSKLSEFELKRGDTEPTEPVIIPERTKVEAETDSIVDIPDNTSITSSNITTIQKSSRGDFFSFYDIIDPSMCFQSCYNHALLVNNVYPKAGEEGAKTNNLSFLMFYAKSRPQKLIKVGNYLEKKAKRDIWNSRPDSKHDHTTIDIDDSFHNKYLQVLKEFCKCCSSEDTNEQKRNDFLNDKDQWSYLHYLTKILKIAMDAIQNQYRYLLITSLFKHSNYIIFVLTFVITSDERSIGLTCLELLDNLTKHLLISVKDKTNSKEDIEVFQSAVIDCIGTLARNIYYPEQTNDMLSFLINRLCFTGDVNKEKKDVPPISRKLLNNLFHCLRRVLENRKVSDSNTSVNYTPVGIPIELITSTNDTAANAKKQTMMNKEYHFVLYDYLNKNDLEVIDYILITTCIPYYLLNYMENIAATIKNDALTKYVNDVKEDRKSTGNYVELDYDPKNIYSYKDKTFKDLGIKEDVVLTPVEEYITRVKIDEFTGINEDLYKNYPILETKKKSLHLPNLLTYYQQTKINWNQNTDYINVDELKNALDVNVKNDYKLEDFNMDGYSNNNVLNNEVSRLLNEITLVNTTTTTKPNAVLEEEEEEEEEEDNDEFATLESPTKSMSTGATTMINVSPTRSGFSPVTSNNKDIFINTEKNDTIQQQSLAYPKMEMQMSTLIIPNSPMDLNNRANTQSIYIKEPALR